MIKVKSKQFIEKLHKYLQRVHTLMSQIYKELILITIQNTYCPSINKQKLLILDIAISICRLSNFTWENSMTILLLKDLGPCHSKYALLK